MKIKLLIEMDLPPFAFDAKDRESVEWFKNDVLLNKTESGGLVLHSNEIGEKIGTVKVLEISGLPSGEVFVCSGCGNEIDPNVCGCGALIKENRNDCDSHYPVPMGCECLRIK